MNRITLLLCTCLVGVFAFDLTPLKSQINPSYQQEQPTQDNENRNSFSNGLRGVGSAFKNLGEQAQENQAKVMEAHKDSLTSLKAQINPSYQQKLPTQDDENGNIFRNGLRDVGSAFKNLGEQAQENQAKVMEVHKEVNNKVGKEIQKNIQTVKQPIDVTLAAVGSSQCENVQRLVGVAYEQLDNEREPDLNQLTLQYADKEVRMIFNITTAAETLLDRRDMDPTRKLYIYVHGFTDDPTQKSFSSISEALLNKGEVNVLALDGSSLIKWLYIRAATYVRFMGEKLGVFLATLVQKGLNPKNIHVIGHSLGAHVSSFTGKTFTGLTGEKIGRITGLDPAGPCFSNLDSDLRLNSTDADYVDVIHTDAGVFGIKDAVGQVDYYPNSGTEQPNCVLQTCSHSRAWQLFTESVTNPEAFPALKCKDWDAFKKGNCESGISYMGFASEPGTTGKYFLQTGDEPPYGLGTNGLVYQNKEGILKNVFG